MPTRFLKTTIAASVMLLLGSGGAWAADATSDAGGTVANSLNTSSGSGNNTVVGNVAPTGLGDTVSTTTIRGGGGSGGLNTSITVGNTVAISGQTSIAGYTSITGGASISGNTTVTGTTHSINGTSSASMAAGSGAFNSKGSFTSYSTQQNVGGAYTLQNPTTPATQAEVLGANVNNIVVGHTLFDGNVYINGSLNYSSSTTAQTTVSSGVSVLAGATQSTTGRQMIANMGQLGAQVDKNGKVTIGIVDQSTASLTMTNGYGQTHGIVVNEYQTTISGGTHSSSLTLDNNGARFSDTTTGGPIRVTGVNDGRHDFDAVNYRQLKAVKAGVAGIAAMGNIPQVESGRKAMLGVGLGHFDGSTAVSVGGSYRMTQDSILKASISSGVDEGRRNSTVVGIGAGFSW